MASNTESDNSSTISFDETEMDGVVKNIYSSCDPENSNHVPVSRIIDFITPYMLKDLNALENLRKALDPRNKDVFVTSEKFYEVINEWSKKMANSSDEESNEFNRTPSRLDVLDERELPYTQSTPRASFGQKLLSCKGLLNISNVSAYSLSTSRLDNSTGAADRTVLEEEIKRLEHQLTRANNELITLKLQLTQSEEQQEILQIDLERVNKRLHSEQQVNELLLKDKKCDDELREDLNSYKKRMEDLLKKLSQYEKDSRYLNNVIKEMEEEKSKLEKKCESLAAREQEAKKEMFTIKTELEMKEQEILTIMEVSKELKMKMNEQKDIIDQLTSENELLNHQKESLEKCFKGKISARSDSILAQCKTCYENVGNSPPQTSKNSSSESFNSPNLISQINNPISPNLGSPIVSHYNKKPQLLKQVLIKNSTPKDNDQEHAVPKDDQQSSFSVETNSDTDSPPILYCINRSPTVQDNSSDEDLYWTNQGLDPLNGSSQVQESLRSEMFKANNNQYSDANYSTFIYEKEERIAELEVQLANHRTCEEVIKQLNNDLISLRLEYDTLKKKTDDVEKENYNLNLEKEELEQLSTEKVELETVIKKLKEEKEEQMEHFTHQLKKSNLELEELQQVLQREVSERNNITENYNKEKIAKEQLNQSCTKVQKELKNIQESLQNEITKKEKNINELNEQNNRLEQSLNNTKNYLNDIQKCLEKNKLDKKGVDDLNKQVVVLTQEKVELENSLGKSNAAVNKLQKSLQQEILCKEKITEDLNKLNSVKQDIQKTLEETKQELEEYIIKSSHVTSLNENIEETTLQVQSLIDKKNAMIKELVELNKKLESNINQTHIQLQEKINEVIELQNILKNDMDIKNNLWKNIQDLKAQLAQSEEKQKSLLDDNQELKNEHSILLNVYDLEVIKNSKLNKHITDLKAELEDVLLKCQQENEKRNRIETKKYEILFSKYEKEMQVNKDLNEKLVNGEHLKLMEYTKKTDTLNQEISVLQHKLARKELLIKSHKDLIAVQQENVNKLLEEKEKLTEELNRSKGDNVKFQSLFQKLDGELVKVKVQNDSLLIELENEKKELLELAQSDRSSNSSTSYEKCYAEPRNKSYEKQQITIEKLREKLEVKESKLRNELSKKEVLVKERNDLLEEKAALESRLKTLEVCNKTYAVEASKNTDIIAELKGANDSYVETIMNLKLEMEERETRLQDSFRNALQKQLELSTKESASLLTKLTEQGEKYKNVFAEILLKDAKILAITEENKNLQNMLSKLEDNKQTELSEIEEKIRSTREVLELTQLELQLTRESLSDVKQEFTSISDGNQKIRRIIFDSRRELRRITLHIVENLKREFKTELDLNYENLLDDIEQSSKSEFSVLNFEEEVCSLNTQIMATVSLLKYLATTFAITAVDPIKTPFSPIEGKLLSKYTLRAPTLIVSRPVSPDSPSLEIDFSSPSICSKTLFKTEETRKDDTLAGLKSKQKSTTEKDVTYDFPCQLTFHILTDEFLETWGLHDINSTKTKEETEDIFTSFASQIALNSKDIKEKIKTQKDVCSKEHEKCLSLIRDALNIIRDCICFETSDTITPISALLNELKVQIVEVEQCAENLALLIYEDRMSVCWNFIVNYVKMLKQGNGSIYDSSDSETPQNNLFAIRYPGIPHENPDRKVSLRQKRRNTIFFCYPRFTTVMVVLILTIVFGFIFLHWYCRITVSDNKDCPLEMFITKKMLGHPPL